MRSLKVTLASVIREAVIPRIRADHRLVPIKSASPIYCRLNLREEAV